MQYTLIEPEWYQEELSAREKKMLMRLEEAEKIIKKPDYDLVKKLEQVDLTKPNAQKKLDEIIAEAKSRPISERKKRRTAVWVVPYQNGKAKLREKRKITEDLTKAQEIETYIAQGTRLVKIPYHRTLFPEGIMDEGKNCQWPFKPEKLELLKD